MVSLQYNDINVMSEASVRRLRVRCSFLNESDQKEEKRRSVLHKKLVQETSSRGRGKTMVRISNGEATVVCFYKKIPPWEMIEK